MGWLARRPKMTLKYITYMLYRRVQRKYQPNRNKKNAQKEEIGKESSQTMMNKNQIKWIGTKSMKAWNLKWN